MPAGLASLTHQSQAFFTLGLAVVFLGEHWRWNHVVGLILAAGGMAVIGLQQNTSMTAIGFWLVLVASFSWAAGNVIMRKVTQGVPPFSMLALVVWSGAVAIVPLFIFSLLLEGPVAWSAAFIDFSWPTLVCLIYLWPMPRPSSVMVYGENFFHAIPQPPCRPLPFWYPSWA